MVPVYRCCKSVLFLFLYFTLPMVVAANYVASSSPLFSATGACLRLRLSSGA